MTPLELSILIHYKGHASDFRDGDFSAPAVREAIDKFLEDDLLKQYVQQSAQRYHLTERGHFFVDELCKVPLPFLIWNKVWVMPTREK